MVVPKIVCMTELAVPGLSFCLGNVSKVLSFENSVDETISCCSCCR